MSNGPLPPEFSAIVEGFLRLTAEGRWLYKGEPIEHPGLLRILDTNLHKDEEGRFLVHLDLPKGTQKVLVEVEDSAYFVRSIDFASSPPRAVLTDETVEPLNPAAMTIGPAGQTYLTVKGGEKARLSRNAELELAPSVEEREGRLGLNVAGIWQPIGGES